MIGSEECYITLGSIYRSRILHYSHEDTPQNIGSYLDPKLTHSKHIDKIKKYPTQYLYSKSSLRRRDIAPNISNATSLILECTSTIWSRITNLQQRLQNYQLCTHMVAHLTLPFNIYMTKETKYYLCTHIWNFTHHKSDTKSQHPTYPLNSLTKHTTPRQLKQTAVINYKYTIHIKTLRHKLLFHTYKELHHTSLIFMNFKYPLWRRV